MRQRTIAKKTESIGIGLHKGEPIKIILEPLPEDSGIVFYRSDEAVTIEAKPENVINTQMATVIGKDGVYVSTIEHLLSAVYSYGIDNIRITLDANEVPIMDGSGVSFCILLDEAGIKEQDAPKKVMKIKKAVEVKHGDKYAKVEPSHSSSSYDFTINFPHPSIGEQNYTFHFSKKGYVEDIAKARTFGFLKDVQMLRAQNLALGGSLENAIVLDDKKILNSEGLRYDDEFVRHKILDAIGDLSLLGMPIICDYSSYAGSHNLNHLLTLEILKSKENYEIVETEKIKDEALQKAFA
jgi:UDP-3-O-[3-hydroxymyristoyl] N-acetylglucosamine deacetylase